VNCPNCDSDDFGAMETDDGVVRGCSDCGYREEASADEVALFLEEDDERRTS
jgi:Zn ribbon nucleic-acid-binding protein